MSGRVVLYISYFYFNCVGHVLSDMFVRTYLMVTMFTLCSRVARCGNGVVYMLAPPTIRHVGSNALRRLVKTTQWIFCVYKVIIYLFIL